MQLPSTSSFPSCPSPRSHPPPHTHVFPKYPFFGNSTSLWPSHGCQNPNSDHFPLCFSMSLNTPCPSPLRHYSPSPQVPSQVLNFTDLLYDISVKWSWTTPADFKNEENLWSWLRSLVGMSIQIREIMIPACWNYKDKSTEHLWFLSLNYSAASHNNITFSQVMFPEAAKACCNFKMHKEKEIVLLHQTLT